MKCVSYTRFTSCLRGSEIPPNIIAQQNDAIGNYAASKGWKIEAKYSDRKNSKDEAAGFYRMKEDGITRKYECIIVMQMERFGPNIFEAVKLLEQVFIPAGMFFAVVEDDFFSGEKTKEEIDAYLRKKKKLYDSEIHAIQSANYRKRIFATYGFKPYSLDDIPEIDAESAAVVKQIFQMYASGKTTTEICNYLNERKIETPSKYNERVCNRKICFSKDFWDTGVINRMLTEEKYIGKWTRYENTGYMKIQTEAVVDEALFRSVDHIRRIKMGKRNTGIPFPNIFRGKVYDADTGVKLHYKYLEGQTPERFFYIKWKKRLLEEGLFLKYDDLYEVVINQLKKEQKKARKALSWMQSKECSALKKRRQQPLLEKAVAVTDELELIEIKRMKQEQKSGYDITNVAIETTDELDKAFREKDEILAGLLQEMKAIETLYSSQNAWIHLFSDIDLSEPVTSTQIFKWIDRILVKNLKEITVIFNQAESRAAFPDTIFEDMGEGTDEQNQ